MITLLKNRYYTPGKMSASALNKGFTLVELIVYVALFGIVLVFLAQFLVQMVFVNVNGVAREAVITNAINALDMIGSETRHAEGVYTPTTTASQLSLVANDKFLTEGGDGFVDIYVSEGRLCVKKDATGVSCVTSPEVVVSNLSFTIIDATETRPAGVQTSVTVEYNTSDSDTRAPYTLQSTAHVRNK